MNWLLTSLNQKGSTVYFPTELAIYTTLTADPHTNLLGHFTSMNANVEPLCIRNTICLPTTFIDLFLKWDLTPMEAWTCLRSAIIYGGLEVDCRPIVNWLSVALTLNTGDEKYPWSMKRPTPPLADGSLLQHRHHMLTRHLPGMEPSLQMI